MKVKALVLIGALMLLMVGFQAVAQDDVIEIEYWQYNYRRRSNTTISIHSMNIITICIHIKCTRTSP
mgnify:CR=1 FL=1